MKLLLYCTKSKPYLNKCKLTNYNKRYFISNTGLWSVNPSTQQIYPTNLNGKVVAECDFEVEEIKYQDIENYNYDEILPLDKILEKSCLTKIDLEDYLNGNNGYAIHIKNLHIFDGPKKLSDYSKRIKNDFQVLGKAPQNMMKCVSLFTTPILDYVLISIQPQWLCKILNGEKTIEIRKKVLRGML